MAPPGRLDPLQIRVGPLGEVGAPDRGSPSHGRIVRIPEPVVETTLAVLGEPNAAEPRLSPDVGRVLGRAPSPFADWACRNIDAFR